MKLEFFDIFMLSSLVFVFLLMMFGPTTRKRRCSSPGTHNYEPRYSEQPRDLSGIKECSAALALELAVYRVYEGDVCKWCGNRINKEG